MCMYDSISLAISVAVAVPPTNDNDHTDSLSNFLFYFLSLIHSRSLLHLINLSIHHSKCASNLKNFEKKREGGKEEEEEQVED